ncbi:CPCC family cysteine-rich protein [Microbulbifer sp. 2201CG32-9]|uniref:CPCC family cysteine-rich protein n=1 Tax=Microbulbifer sp. 2201CG32-9 TaxID=3232309 RepID=UPI00345C4F41
MSEEWFHWYVEQATKEKRWARYRDRFLCPCCFMPTLDERARFDICSICFWEDDGQDTDDAEIVRGGPNADYSLKEARANFKLNHTMYRAADKEAFSREMKEMPIKKKVYQAFARAIKSGSDSDWEKALEIEDEYYNHS